MPALGREGGGADQSKSAATAGSSSQPVKGNSNPSTWPLRKRSILIFKNVNFDGMN